MMINIFWAGFIRRSVKFKTEASWEGEDFDASFCAVFRVFTYEGVEIFWGENHGCVELAKLYHFTLFFFNKVFF